MKYTTVINNKFLCFVDRMLRLFNYFIVLEGVDMKSKEFDGWKIKHVSKIQWK